MIVENLDRDAEYSALRDPVMHDYPATASELRFYRHPLGMGGVLAQILYPNGYVVSVVCGLPPCDDGEYEVEVLHADGFAWQRPRRLQDRRAINAILRDVFEWKRYTPQGDE